MIKRHQPLVFAPTLTRNLITQTRNVAYATEHKSNSVATRFAKVTNNAERSSDGSTNPLHSRGLEEIKTTRVEWKTSSRLFCTPLGTRGIDKAGALRYCGPRALLEEQDGFRSNSCPLQFVGPAQKGDTCITVRGFRWKAQNDEAGLHLNPKILRKVERNKMDN